MSVFSKIKMSKKAAKDHKIAEASKENEQPAKVPYKHVPKHAASDAMHGCPQAWVDLNREKIVAHNKHNSRIALDAARERSQSASRAGSMRSGSSDQSVGGISIKTYTSRIVLEGAPKNRKQNAYFQTFPDRQTLGVQRAPVPRAVSSSSFQIGAYHGTSYGSTQRLRRGLSYQDSAIGRSPLSSGMNSAEESQVNSSGNSITSSENLEISMPSSSRSQSQRPQHRYTLPANGSNIKRNTSDPKISSGLRSSVINADNLPSTPIAAVVKPGPMPVAVVEKKRMSLFGKKRMVAAAAA